MDSPMTHPARSEHCKLTRIPLAALLSLALLVPTVHAQQAPAARVPVVQNEIGKHAALSVSDVQILFADLQAGLVSTSTTVEPKTLAASAGALAKAAHILGIPMTFAIVPQAGKPGQLIPELRPYASKTNTINRVIASPFSEPALVSALAENRRKVLVIVGFATEVAVLQGALDGIAAGYTVQVPVDGIGSRSERTEQAAIRQIERAGGVTTSVLSLVAKLAPDFSRAPGSETLKAVISLH
jgi:nicotinamidase-related amidase